MRQATLGESAMLLFGALFSIQGCSRPTRSPIVQVKGKIQYDNGTKLPPGSIIVFSPVLGGAGSAMAETDAEGNFSLTHASGARGAEVGDYLVELRSPKGQEREFYASVPENYTNGGGLAATISGDESQLELVLKNSRKRKSTIGYLSREAFTRE